jgi:hypothetical protein
MNQEKSVILIEFNELAPTLMAKFIAAGKLPNFKRLQDESEVYLTDAGEEPPNLEPWIQWVSVHSGLTFPEHGIFHLGDGDKLKAKCIWDVLSQANYRVGVCGSMNVRYDRPINGYVLPDPWTTGSHPFPDTLLPYFKFVQRNVQEYTNERVPLSLSDYIQFLYFMVTHGLSFWTVKSIISQLFLEAGGKHRWKRAQILDKLQFDVFRWYHKKTRPHFSTYFSNSTAHLQHMYWRNMEPGLFKVKPTAGEQAEFDQAILSGYQEMDQLIARFLALADDQTTLVFATALSQQPCLIYEDQGAKQFYRPREFEDVLSFAGITAAHKVFPVMSEQFHIYFDGEQEAIDAEQKLRALRLGERVALYVERNGKTVFSGCTVFENLPQEISLTINDSNRSRPFFDIFYKVEGKKSGMHHADGMLWIRHPERQHTVHDKKVPLTFIAPTILKMFGLSLTPKETNIPTVVA